MEKRPRMGKRRQPWRHSSAGLWQVCPCRSLPLEHSSSFCEPVQSALHAPLTKSWTDLHVRVFGCWLISLITSTHIFLHGHHPIVSERHQPGGCVHFPEEISLNSKCSWKLTLAVWACVPGKIIPDSSSQQVGKSAEYTEFGLQLWNQSVIQPKQLLRLSE